MLVDNGSVVNILPKSTVIQLGISVEELSNSKLAIQGFNEGAQRAIGTICFEIAIGYLQASTIFHGIRKVDADIKPFSKAKSHIADGKFYTKSDDVREVLSTEVPMAKGTYKHNQGMVTKRNQMKGMHPIVKKMMNQRHKLSRRFNFRLHSTFCISKAKHNCIKSTIYKANFDHKRIFLQKVKRIDIEPEDEVDVAGCHVTIEETFDHETFEEDAEAALLSLEDRSQSTIDDLIEVNLGATYQRAMQRIFDDMLHKRVECYVDDLVVKSKKKCDHMKDLKLVLDRLRKYQLRMNPLICAFNVTLGKFMGFIVRHNGIKVDHSKIDAIQKMPSLNNLHELRRLQGRLAYIKRFISNIAD
ncbi:uncharacterized protein E5676_scaffold14G00880 [Cucumis melo var. makuwa]|uniref:Reverse transcriptase domain-containing protein n=1 Tax=Cucumis melo var. makuwa TaxID=1194695 RepID=A0A5A7VN82_CUCMM|nr:uncharacterized protein E6C27_scaffold38G001230 [Cucumis melo var. makuwa]TYK26308.1 uncharacterized protein E5676_scaffold14G00880 [Cucumis melo var. makuwa]